jgi:hypothetical protein
MDGWALSRLVRVAARRQAEWCGRGFDRGSVRLYIKLYSNLAAAGSNGGAHA